MKSVSSRQNERPPFLKLYMVHKNAWWPPLAETHVCTSTRSHVHTWTHAYITHTQTLRFANNYYKKKWIWIKPVLQNQSENVHDSEWMRKEEDLAFHGQKICASCSTNPPKLNKFSMTDCESEVMYNVYRNTKSFTIQRSVTMFVFQSNMQKSNMGLR